ncbi:PAS domain-containing protein [Pontibacter sp. 172403-2]|uniref:LuxR C-terminal-related transcriptional regulator n=1 Tax=Pontibacter rufus TaxID=2791028 RepID=UPI0018B014AC|nr:LuxR C-terminal-related transcriptional regulator [Pontibacter sp. 172403-2]MBF9255686.1 PAS domain-containing protein [Pontibacter sp. 172403-2]
MKPVIHEQAQKIWKFISERNEDGRTVTAEDTRFFALELHKKLLSFFQIGEYYYFILDVRAFAFDMVSEEVTSVLGYAHEEVDLPLILSIIHPEDQRWFLSCEKKVGEFFSGLTLEQIPNYKVRYDYRIRKKKGDYIRILQQVVTIQFDEHGHVLRTLGIHTDISHLKQEGLPVLSFIGLNGEPSFINVTVEEVRFPTHTLLSARERDVLLLLVQGYNSEEIGEKLFISKSTVQTHRKNMLLKTGCKSTPALVSFAVKSGVV